MSGVKGRSGRRKSIPTLVADALEGNERNLPVYLERLQGIALNKLALPKDRVECLEYLVNRALGSPKATTDLRVRRIWTLTGEYYEGFCRRLDSARKEEWQLIEQYSGLQKGEGYPLLCQPV